MAADDRIETGVKGLDEKIGGGLPRGSVTLLTGGPGSGKTTFCSNFIEKGLENGEDCLFITTGQAPEEVVLNAENVGVELEGENLAIAHVTPSNDVADSIRDRIAQQSFDRIVLDSLSVFQMFWGEQDHLRKYINKLMQHLSEIDSTVVLTSERPNDGKSLTRFGIAEFMVDGVIVLSGYALGETSYRSMTVVKMRRTPIDGSSWTMEIGEGGISVRDDEKL